MTAKQPSYQEEILRRDYGLADTVRIQLEMGQRSLGDVTVLENFIEVVRDDIKYLDPDTRKYLDTLIKELDTIFDKQKNEWTEFMETYAEDNLDENTIKNMIISKRFIRLKKELSLIKQLAYDKKWFE